MDENKVIYIRFSRLLKMIIAVAAAFFLFFVFVNSLAKAEERITEIRYEIGLKTKNPFLKILGEAVLSLKKYKEILWEEKIVLSDNLNTKRMISISNKKEQLFFLLDSKESMWGDEKMSEENVSLAWMLLNFAGNSDSAPGSKKEIVFMDSHGKKKALKLEVASQSQDFTQFSGEFYEEDKLKALFQLYVARSGTEKSSIIGAQVKYNKFGTWLTLVVKMLDFKKEVIK